MIGYPVCIREGKYSRNEFIFNFALVIAEDELDWACYGEVVRKLGRLLRGLEEQGGFLSKEEEGVWDDDTTLDLPTDEHFRQAPFLGAGVGTGSKVYALCEMVLEDLNNYAECMIPIGNQHPLLSSSKLAILTFGQTTPTRSTSSSFPPVHHLHPYLHIKYHFSLYL